MLLSALCPVSLAFLALTGAGVSARKMNPHLSPKQLRERQLDVIARSRSLPQACMDQGGGPGSVKNMTFSNPKASGRRRNRACFIMTAQYCCSYHRRQNFMWMERLFLRSTGTSDQVGQDCYLSAMLQMKPGSCSSGSSLLVRKVA